MSLIPAQMENFFSTHFVSLLLARVQERELKYWKRLPEPQLRLGYLCSDKRQADSRARVCVPCGPENYTSNDCFMDCLFVPVPLSSRLALQTQRSMFDDDNRQRTEKRDPKTIFPAAFRFPIHSPLFPLFHRLSSLCVEP